ncbi:transcription factor AP-2-delta [Platysternon megacephalum]|uniref:Transcription factor AP-2-delta n=1 Tax=Platysternon megacephalum TaxID=55544 RepID=A0A4D9EJU6_9SAUR|nr:transcription factor AP-2-delta [Platysternon megacephalum]
MSRESPTAACYTHPWDQVHKEDPTLPGAGGGCFSHCLSNGDGEPQPYAGRNHTHRRGQPGLCTRARESGSAPAPVGSWVQCPAPLHSSQGKLTPVLLLAGPAAQTQDSMGGGGSWVSVFYFKGGGGKMYKITPLKTMPHGELPPWPDWAPATTDVKRPCRGRGSLFSYGLDRMRAHASPYAPLALRGVLPLSSPPGCALQPSLSQRSFHWATPTPRTRLGAAAGTGLRGGKSRSRPRLLHFPQTGPWPSRAHRARGWGGAPALRCTCVRETQPRGKGQRSTRALLLLRLEPVLAARLPAARY